MRPAPFLLAVALTALAGCAVKPPLRYVAPDGTLHEVAVEPQRLRQRQALDVPRRSGDGVEAPEPLGGSNPDDEARAHYATAVGLQAGCRYGEALAHFRGYLEASPDGELVGRTMVRMAEIYREPGFAGRDDERARELLAEVVARFPGTAAATLACDMAGDLCAP